MISYLGEHNLGEFFDKLESFIAELYMFQVLSLVFYKLYGVVTLKNCWVRKTKNKSRHKIHGPKLTHTEVPIEAVSQNEVFAKCYIDGDRDYLLLGSKFW